MEGCEAWDEANTELVRYLASHACLKGGGRLATAKESAQL